MGELKADCILCGREVEHEPLCDVSFGSIVRCRECSLIHIWPARTDREMVALHNDPEYFNHPYFIARRDVDRNSARLRHRNLLKEVVGEHPSPGLKLLDIGCDTGAFLLVARDEFHLTVTGCEVSPAAAEVAVKQHQLDVRVGQVADLNLDPESFDIITMVDVIEHTANPAALLRDVFPLLRKGGRLYIATSDHDALINDVGLILHRVFGRTSRPLLEKLYIPEHEFYFTRRTLSAIVQQANFEVVSHINYEFPLDEFGHGLVLKLGLIPMFALQKIFKKQTLQALTATKK